MNAKPGRRCTVWAGLLALAGGTIWVTLAGGGGGGDVLSQGVTVLVSDGKEATVSAVGFGHFEGAKVLKLTLSAPAGYVITFSDCDNKDGDTLWAPDPAGSNTQEAASHTWKTIGLSSPDIPVGAVNFAATFTGKLKRTKAGPGPGGAATQPTFEVRVAEIDLDGDTDNDEQSVHRPPEGDADEDEREYPLSDAPEDDRVGIVIGINDDNDESWDSRDYELGIANYQADDEVLELNLVINARKAGTFYVDALDGPLWLYDTQNREIDSGQGFDTAVPKGDGFQKTLRIETHPQLTVSGTSGKMVATFTADPASAGSDPADYVNWVAVGTDVDVDSDNSGGQTPIENTNTRDGSGEAHEDFYENHAANTPQGKEQYKHGMIVPVNDDNDGGDSGADNGWDGTDWDGPDAAVVVEGEDDLKPMVLRKLNLEERHWTAMEEMGCSDPAITLRQASGTGALRVFTADGCVLLNNTAEGAQTTLPGGTSLWDALKSKTSSDLDLRVEGLKAGSVVMEVRLSLDGTSGPVIHTDKVLITVVQTSIHIYNEHDGPVLPPGGQTQPGSFVLLNKDDDDGAGGEDRSNNVIDGDGDKLDMAKLQLSVHRPDLANVNVQLDLPEGDRAFVRVFDETGTAVTQWPNSIGLSRFADGPLSWHVEGLAVGSATFTLTVKDGEVVKYSGSAKVTVKDYHAAFNAWGAWPGSQYDTSLNPTETITSADLGLSGEVQWAIDHGGTAAAIISHIPETGTKWHTVVVRYDDCSSDASFTKAAEIKAFDTGMQSKLAGVRRTVFQITMDPVNLDANLDGHHTLSYERAGAVGDVRRAGVVTRDEAKGILRYAAKVEIKGRISPAGIQWSQRGVSFIFGEGTPSKWQFQAWQQYRAADAGQQIGNQFRELSCHGNWTDDRWPSEFDTWYPSLDTPDRFYAIDPPGWGGGWYQNQFRDDFRTYVRWSDRGEWQTCSPYAQWWCELTSVYPGNSPVQPNRSGEGAWDAGEIANTRPTVTPCADQQVTKGATVTLSATSVDADGQQSEERDADNDQLAGAAWIWTQTGGPPVTLSNGGVGRVVTFTAPEVQQQTALTFAVRVSDPTSGVLPEKCRPSNYVSAPGASTVTVNPQ